MHVKTEVGIEITKIVFKRYKSGKYNPKTYLIQDIGNLSILMNSVSNTLDMLITAMPPLA